MGKIYRGADGIKPLVQRRSFKRKHWEKMKEKEKKCWTCGSMPWRVEEDKCEDCGLGYQDESLEIELPTLQSSQGTFEDKF